jgi:hypothetical protein
MSVCAPDITPEWLGGHSGTLAGNRILAERMNFANAGRAKCLTLAPCLAKLIKIVAHRNGVQGHSSGSVLQVQSVPMRRPRTDIFALQSDQWPTN